MHLRRLGPTLSRLRRHRQQTPHPCIDAASVRDYLTYLAVRRQVSASTQYQALCALLFLCREVLNLDLADLSATARAKRGPRLPTVLSVPETTALLGAMRGTPWLMAALIYGGGLRVTECCQDPRTGLVRRHHVSDSVVQKAVKAAAREAKIHKPTSVHTLRHCFGTHLLLSGVDIRQIQEYLGHTNVETTMVYTHVVKELRTPPRSPLDALQAARR